MQSNRHKWGGYEHCPPTHTHIALNKRGRLFSAGGRKKREKAEKLPECKKKKRKNRNCDLLQNTVNANITFLLLMQVLHF